MNSLYQQQMGQQLNGHNMSGLMQRFQQFQQMFKGDPRQQVQNLLNSGKVSQQQYNNAVQMANQLQRMMGGK
jgi:vancomycin permeability regulator SanA